MSPGKVLMASSTSVRLCLPSGIFMDFSCCISISLPSYSSRQRYPSGKFSHTSSPESCNSTVMFQTARSLLFMNDLLNRGKMGSSQVQLAFSTLSDDIGSGGFGLSRSLSKLLDADKCIPNTNSLYCLSVLTSMMLSQSGRGIPTVFFIYLGGAAEEGVPSMVISAAQMAPVQYPWPGSIMSVSS